ncbi:MAG: 30S ribosomal protein S17e [Nanoarchaeota archaeon]
MGRIKTKLVKRITKELIKQHGEKLKTDFEENKKIISGLAEISSKKVRNVIAGYTTKQIKAQKQER